MKLQRTLISILAWMVLSPIAARGTEPLAKSSTPAFDISKIQSATRELSRSLDELIEHIVDGLPGKEEKPAYLKAESILDQVGRFESSLKPDASRAELYRAFDDLDGKLTTVLGALETLKPNDGVWQRALLKVRTANEELLYAIALGDKSAERVRQVVTRQIRTLSDACERLERTARYALVDTPGTVLLISRIKQLCRASEALNARTGQIRELQDLSKEAGELTGAWEKVTLSFRMLAPKNNIHLLRNAGNVDRIHQRIFHLLEQKGECPVLIIRS